MIDPHFIPRHAIDFTGLHPWVLPFEEPQRPDVRLLCLPYAGGGVALYRRWRQTLPPSVSVVPIELPGREVRFREAAFSEITPLIDALVDNLAPLFEEPFALFGHSMGALVSYELARRLAARDRLPVHLFISARRPPDLETMHPPFFALPRDEFIAKIQHWYGAFPAMVLNDPVLLTPFLPTMRADIKLLDTYEHVPGEPLSCPITVLGGLHDHAVPPASLRGWQRHTSKSLTIKLVSGHHFFVRDQMPDVVRIIAKGLGITQP